MGQLAKDVVHLSDKLVIEDQVFAQITSFHHYETCGNEEGRIGLGFKEVSEVFLLTKYPTPLTNLKDQLTRAVFSLYLDKVNDYSGESQYKDIDESGSGSGASSANSEIVFGGVDQKYYDGCLTWHRMNQFDGDEQQRAEEAEFVSGYWNFRLDKVLIGDSEVADSSGMAFVDSGSSFLMGPNKVINEFIKQNKFVCYDMFFPDEPDEIDCFSSFGYDLITIDCDGALYSLDFVAGGKKYSLDKGDITIKMNTTIGELCVVPVLGHDEPGWILGDSFLNANYIAFDLDNMQVGLAPLATDISDDICRNDWSVDITNEDVVAAAPKKKTGSESELESESGRNVALIAGVTVAISASVFLVLILLARRGKRRYQRYDYVSGKFDRHVNLAIRETELPRMI